MTDGWAMSLDDQDIAQLLPLRRDQFEQGVRQIYFMLIAAWLTHHCRHLSSRRIDSGRMTKTCLQRTRRAKSTALSST